MTALFLAEPSTQIPPCTALKAATTNRPVLALEMKVICNPIFIACNDRYKDSKGDFILSREGCVGFYYHTQCVLLGPICKVVINEFSIHPEKNIYWARHGLSRDDWTLSLTKQTAAFRRDPHPGKEEFSWKGSLGQFQSFWPDSRMPLWEVTQIVRWSACPSGSTGPAVAVMKDLQWRNLLVGMIWEWMAVPLGTAEHNFPLSSSAARSHAKENVAASTLSPGSVVPFALQALDTRAWESCAYSKWLWQPCNWVITDSSWQTNSTPFPCRSDIQDSSPQRQCLFLFCGYTTLSISCQARDCSSNCPLKKTPLQGQPQHTLQGKGNE